MKFTCIVLLVFLKILSIEMRMVPIQFKKVDSSWNRRQHPVTPVGSLDDKVVGLNLKYEQEDDEYDIEYVKKMKKIETPVERMDDKVIGLNLKYEQEDDEYDIEYVKKRQKPCAVVILSNVQNPTMQSLLRRYRYDSNGILIPSSVQYFIKVPQGISSTPMLVPLNDKAFSPVGGFVRYYKEVPPIPHTY